MLRTRLTLYVLCIILINAFGVWVSPEFPYADILITNIMLVAFFAYIEWIAHTSIISVNAKQKSIEAYVSEQLDVTTDSITVIKINDPDTLVKVDNIVYQLIHGRNNENYLVQTGIIVGAIVDSRRIKKEKEL